MTIAKIALQIIVGLTFLFTGGTKLFVPKEKLATKGVTGFEDMPPQWIKYLAWTEITGALVLITFSLSFLPQVLTKITVIGFALLMLAATYHHAKRGEYKNIGVTLLLFATCLLIWFLNGTHCK
jgi:DoxX-like family